MSTAAAHRIALLAVLIAAFALLGPSRSESGLAFRANGVSAAGVQRFPVMRVSKRQYGLDANDDDDDEGDDDDDDDDDDSDERRRLQRRQRRQKKSKKTKTAKKKKTAKKAPKKKKTTKKKTTKNKKDTKKAKKEKTTKGGCVPKGIRGRLPKPLPASCTPALLEQYCNVAKNQKDPACADLLGCVPKKGLMGSAKLPDPLPASCTPEKLAAYCAKPTSSKDPACGDASNCVPDTEDEEGNMILSNPPAPECNPASLKAYCKSLGSAKNSEPQCASGLSRAIKSVKKAVSGAFAAFAPQIQELGTMIGIENYTPLRFATDFGPILVQSKGDAKKMARAIKKKLQEIAVDAEGVQDAIALVQTILGQSPTGGEEEEGGEGEGDVSPPAGDDDEAPPPEDDDAPPPPAEDDDVPPPEDDDEPPPEVEEEPMEED